VPVLAFAHHEHAVRPEQQVSRERGRGERRRARGLDVVPVVFGIEVRGRTAPIDVRGTDEQYALPGQEVLQGEILAGRRGTSLASLGPPRGPLWYTLADSQ
jgi:hypothetical protein